MKKCPFCAEKIQDEAIVCRYCGRDLEPTSNSLALDHLDKLLTPIEEQFIGDGVYFTPGDEFPWLCCVENGKIKSYEIRYVDAGEYWNLPSHYDEGWLNTKWLTTSKNIYLYSPHSLLTERALAETLYVAEFDGEVKMEETTIQGFLPDMAANNPKAWKNIDKGKITHKARLVTKLTLKEILLSDLLTKFAIDCAERAVTIAEEDAKYAKNHELADELLFYRECLEYARARYEEDFQRLDEICGNAYSVFGNNSYSEKLASEMGKRFKNCIYGDTARAVYCLLLDDYLVNSNVVIQFKRNKANNAAWYARQANQNYTVKRFQRLGFKHSFHPQTKEEKLISNRIFGAIQKEELDWQANHLLSIFR